MTPSRLVEITPAAHDVELDLVYATDRNLTGRPIYRHAHCLLLPAAAAALRRAVRIAAQAGLRLRLYDAYRPPEAQRILWNWLPDPAYIADPARGSNHSRGAALDLTLVGADGHALDMGTGFDEMTPDSQHFRDGLPEAVQRNRLLLLGVMRAAGFAHIAGEWWHYELPDARALPQIGHADCGPWRLM
ncbi:D-alanyl-D-alanine dipeptidase [Burkholderia sp. FERM BP-3421]|jgi:D-alanyl-D-alanine dipeptidase|uniref:D-alanyl-D-alanine dipeptidase n=1 Tax=Burkholderia sp. FERM BP-3421 TaxID=1494466 RepID=UPI00235E9D52|nr:D-alanyl-D-alanine dipeptidase [Burkholderia sp. FERM BP-3421]WDD92044.1 D-alanyl-D-alanine dipeptidase [Burkholderia sp. FERM BP-3421]